MNRAERRAAMRQAAANSSNRTASINERTNISEAQLAANRANAQNSCGPKTDAGRARSSQNRLTHGLARHNGAFQVLPSEDQNGFEALRQSLNDEHQPATPDEFNLINEMAESLWLTQRAKNLQHTCFNPATGELTDEKKLAVYLRYGTSHANQFHKCLNALLKIKAQKEKAANGFEAQKRHAMKKEGPTPPDPKAIEMLKSVQTTACDPKLAADISAYLKKHGVEHTV